MLVQNQLSPTLLCSLLHIKLKVLGCLQLSWGPANAAESWAGAGRHGYTELVPASKRLRLMHVTTPRFVLVLHLLKCFLGHSQHLHSLVVSQNSVGHFAHCRIRSSTCNNISPVHSKSQSSKRRYSINLSTYLFIKSTSMANYFLKTASFCPPPTIRLHPLQEYLLPDGHQSIQM